MAKTRESAAALADPPKPEVESARAVAEPPRNLADAPFCPNHPAVRTERQRPGRSVLARYRCPMENCRFAIDLPLVGMQHARPVEVDVPMPR